MAWHPLGWQPQWFSEIEAFPSAVLAHHYPDVPNYGDMTTYKEWSDDPIDLLVGGTPCQSFSVAGLRKGLDDPRGNLMLTYLAIAERYQPRWLVWENVPGVLSSNRGRDFGTFLGALGQIGYGFAYRVLDAQYFGVAQRRRRVFVVGYLGDWRRAAAVLFERESLSGHPAPSRETREETAEGSSPRVGSGKSNIGTLMANAGTKLWLRNQEAFSGDYHILQPIAFGAQNSASQGDSASEHVTPTLDKSKTPAVTVALRGREGGATAEIGGEVATALRASQGGGDKPHVLTPMAVRRLTPRECERLQGFPDDYTLIPYRGKLAADSPRYKSMGNSMAVPVMRWIGQRIQMVESIQ